MIKLNITKLDLSLKVAVKNNTKINLKTEKK